jgi:exodeoxyribonuclease VII large subunit
MSKKQYRNQELVNDDNKLLDDFDKVKIKPICNEYNTVSDLNVAIKQTLEQPYTNIKVSGEISNFKISNKNLFATLKDNESCINVVAWGYEYRKNKIEMENGDKICIHGKITHHSKSGNYCLLAFKFEKLGTGDLHQQYEQLKKKYEDLGYYKDKKTFPQQVNRIGIVTALEGAALQDILYVLKTNEFNGKVVIKGCKVQGNQAPQSIVEGINNLMQWKDDKGRLDLIIITRGGGSLEDLIGFSSNDVIVAIHNCDIFTISAVGHEIDFMLSDYVADIRAPTPSVSAEIITTSQKSRLQDYNKCKSFAETQMKQIILAKLNSLKEKVTLLLKSVENPDAKIMNSESQLEIIKNHIITSLRTKILQNKNKLEKLSVKLQKYDISTMLERGYAVVIKNNRIIDSVKDISDGQKLKLKMKDGDLTVIVTS